MDPIVEVVALILGFVGWVMVGVALPNRYWKVSTVDGSVITTSTIYENLWMSCATDSTGVHNCREFPSLLALNGSVSPSTGSSCHYTASCTVCVSGSDSVEQTELLVSVL
uniref:Claudin n=1 Tax=Xiphophorus couchianus TaxID=32473 RepID=A0A3B5KVM0_9TELE